MSEAQVREKLWARQKVWKAQQEAAAAPTAGASSAAMTPTKQNTPTRSSERSSGTRKSDTPSPSPKRSPGYTNKPSGGLPRKLGLGRIDDKGAGLGKKGKTAFATAMASAPSDWMCRSAATAPPTDSAAASSRIARPSGDRDHRRRSSGDRETTRAQKVLV